MKIPTTVRAVKPECRPTFVHFANISPAMIKPPTTVKNAGSAEFTKVGLSTVMYAMFAWIKLLRQNINAGPAQGMMSAAFVLRMLFRAVRSYRAPIEYTWNVQKPWFVMESEPVRFVATLSALLLQTKNETLAYQR